MANTFHEVILLYEGIGHVPENSVWIEIGSERGEGSTLALAGQAQRYGTHLHSVDIDTAAKQSLDHPALTCWVANGSWWAKKIFPTFNQSISMLYLDNFDWIWQPSEVPNWIQQQIDEYKNKFQLVMNNQRCQIEHLAQALHLLPWLNNDCLVAMDDTYLYNGVWTGKCGPVVSLLSIHDFRVVHTTSAGTVMARGLKHIEKINTDHMLFY